MPKIILFIVLFLGWRQKSASRMEANGTREDKVEAKAFLTHVPDCR
jgi:hypothetical protein